MTEGLDDVRPPRRPLPAAGPGGRRRVDRQARGDHLPAGADAQADVRPLRMVNGDSEFNEVFWTGVHVDAADVLGEVGRGWPVALTTLGFERGSLALVTSVSTRRAMDALVGRGRAGGADTNPVVPDRSAPRRAPLSPPRRGW